MSLSHAKYIHFIPTAQSLNSLQDQLYFCRTSCCKLSGLTYHTFLSSLFLQVRSLASLCPLLRASHSCNQDIRWIEFCSWAHNSLPSSCACWLISVPYSCRTEVPYVLVDCELWPALSSLRLPSVLCHLALLVLLPESLSLKTFTWLILYPKDNLPFVHLEIIWFGTLIASVKLLYLCSILLARSKSQFPPTLKGRGVYQGMSTEVSLEYIWHNL